jgi:aspartyl-tRNA(Asn)/glutamyl-tRNA(Gln) amidotransferase subunit B
MATTFGGYELVIGLEVHAQLLTRTKAFCGCATSFGDGPNIHTCAVCLGMPGSLPVLNQEAVRMAVSAALAVGCTINTESIFARKNYFYPDLPKGYQISQYDRPLASCGALEIEADLGKRRVGILRIHMEEDAGKNIHGVGDASIVDLNRAGTPLIEIVSDPDLRSAAEAAEYLRRLRELLMFIGVNDGNLEQGSFRCDANVSVRKIGATALGTRTELKNINSFRFVADAIEIEARRQVALLERGERVRQQTRGYNADKRETYLLRDKENEAGYRYFPEPDLPPLVVDEVHVKAVRSALPVLPAERRRRLVEEFSVSPNAAGVLTSHPRIASFFDEALRRYPDPVKLGNFIQAEVMRDVRTDGLEASLPVSPAQVAELLRLVDDGTISGKQGKEVYAAIVGTATSPGDIVKERSMAVLSDEGEIEAISRRLIEENPKQAAGYRAGKSNLLGYFVGQLMKKTGGSASPALANTVLKRLLEWAPGAHAAPASTPDVGEPAAAAPARSSSGAGATSLPRRVTPERDTDAPPAPLPSPLAESVAPAAPTQASPEADATSEALAALASIVPRQQPAAVEPAAELVAFDAFAKLDLRVGVVVSAARVPRKDKLLDLRIDTGDASGPRRVVSGLALSFTPEELVGQRVIVVCNLEPRAFSKELVSHGMILAAGPSDALALGTVSKNTPAGTPVK